MAEDARRAERSIEHPYLLFLGDARDDLAAKTAQGLVGWRPDWCAGQIRLAGCNADLGLPELTIGEAVAQGARTMVIGVANAGGVLPESWSDVIVEALEQGLDVASGLHNRLVDLRPIREASARHGRRLFDVRHPDREFATGQGSPRPGRRLLTVGTDCSCGKMYAALAIEREMHARGMKADFRATGQSGIMIAGGGVAIDAVVADFISGATEWLCPANEEDHWDLIEGQGSLFHPSFAGVSLGLLHGAQPHALVMCHEPTRSHMRGLPHQPLPSLVDCIEGNLAAARLTSPEVRCIGICLNGSKLAADTARDLKGAIEDETGLPCVDPMVDGVARLVDALV